MVLEWDVRKAESNFKKHGVRFSETSPVFEDDFAITITDDESDIKEQRFVSMGTGAKGRVLVVVCSHSGKNIRVISARGRPSRMSASTTRTTDEEAIRFQPGKAWTHCSF